MSIQARRTLSKVSGYILSQIEDVGKPIISEFELCRFVAAARDASERHKLGVRTGQTLLKDFDLRKANLIASNKMAVDPDYNRSAILRVLTIPDLYAEEIVCLADPLAYISHLSAMQRWGFTLRVAKFLQISRPNKTVATNCLEKIVTVAGVDARSVPINLTQATHPKIVRKMPLSVYVSDKLGASRISPGSFTRMATVGQTFADMVQEPDLCGGMGHVINAWEEHAATYLPMIIEAVEAFCGDLGKSRAGHILDERLGLHHPLLAKWKANSILGERRKLDPSREYGLQTSKTWNLSLNV